MKSSIPLRILTHNIRYATTSPFRGEELWTVRAPRLINELRYNTLNNPEAFICLQEVLHSQLHDILNGMNVNTRFPEEKWTWIGVGRDDGKTAGEFSPILYRPAIWSIDMFKTVWLSETPTIPSKGWDAASVRIVTVGRFQHKRTERRIVALNTHMDDQGVQARFEGAKLIVRLANNCTKSPEDQGAGSLPVFLAGDLNSKPDEEAYGVLNADDSPVHDLRDAVPPADRYGHENTFTGFGFETEPVKRIDFIFTGKNCLNVKGYSVLENRFDDGVYNSDHRAVVGDISLEL
jgi:endonuclease/exonuclease/phosphatase family metal-dependent hydrolase